jgi:hypothetical protein
MLFALRTPSPLRSRCLPVFAVALLLGGGLSSLSAGQGRVPEVAGTIDIHAHSHPDSIPRSIDAVSLALLARERGMRALVLKNHFSSTAGLAYLVRQMVTGFEVMGGVVLNRAVGGVNPAAVEQMAKVFGGLGRVVWMPTFDAEYYVRSETPAGQMLPPFVSVARAGALLAETEAVIGLIAEHGMVLATGHSSPEETLLLLREGRRQGVGGMVVTHASPNALTLAQIREMANEGAYLELAYLPLIGFPPEVVTAAQYAEVIRQVGAGSVILSTDLGQTGNPLHPDGLAAFMAAMVDEGVSDEDIALMTRENPARLLGLAP